jgi:beta-lactamase regulating signal transducer with metallopeptidase domain
VIILPQWFAFEPSDELLVAAVAHEMAHVRRADFAWLLIEESLLTCLAYHPLAMLIRRRLHQTRETACDEVAAMLVPDRKSYAHSLLTIASNVATPRSAAIAFAGEDFTGLRDRIRRLASPPRRQPAWMPAVAGFLILVTASLAGSHAVTIERPAYISPNLNIIAKASPAITVYQSPGADRIFKDTRRKGVGTSARRRQDYPPPPPPPPPPPEILNDQR